MARPQGSAAFIIGYEPERAGEELTMNTTDTGPISRAIGERPPFGPMERLDHDQLVKEQQASLESERRRYSLSAQLLFRTMDALYGRGRTLEKFRVLELVARVPYQAWENVAYVAMTHTARQPGFARRVFDRVRTSRWEQDNEQWHLLILEELTASGPRRAWLRSRVFPQVLAFAYYQLSWFLFAIRPAWSYRINADFEDHAEHEYAHLVEENPEWERVPYDGQFVGDFGAYASLADLFRQIGYDERLHKLESELHIRQPRFR
jgi:ubiquinol oxidase